MPLEKIEGAAEKLHPEFLVPPGRRPFAIVPPGPHTLPGIYPLAIEEASMIQTHSSQAELFLGYLSSVFQPIPSPCHDPIFGNPDANYRPGQGGGLICTPLICFKGFWDAW